MIRTMLVLAAAALLAGPATAQTSRPNDKPAAAGATSAKPGETVYRLIDDPPTTTGFSNAPVVVMPPPITGDEPIYSYGSGRACSPFDFDRQLC